MRAFPAITLSLMALPLAACGPTLEESMQSFMGLPKDRLYEAWGSPQKVTPLSGGEELLEYVDTYQVRQFQPTQYASTPHCYANTAQTTGQITTNGLNPSQASYNATTQYNQRCVNFLSPVAAPPPTYESRSCYMRFTVDKVGLLRKWSSQGC